MYFDLTDEQKMLQANLRALLADTVDLNALTQATPESIAALQAKLDAELAAMGVPAVLASAEHGGLELGLLTLAAVSEEIGRSAAPTASVRNALAAWLIAEAGDDAQRGQWLAPLVDGSMQAAFASTQLGFADGAVTGLAHFVEGGASANLYIADVGDGRLVLVAAGVEVSAVTPPALDVARATSTITFKAAPAALLKTTPDLAERLRQAQLIVHAADAYGAGQRALDMAVAYAQERRQFDRPIGSFQAIKHQLAETALVMAPARFLPWRAAHAWDTAPAEAGRLAALAKAHTPEVAVTTARAMVEAHGGVGYTWEYPLHLFLKRAMYDRAAWGGPALHRAAAARSAAW